MKYFYLLLSLLSVSLSIAQNRNEYAVLNSDTIPKIDGIIQEEIWDKAAIATGFHNNWPTDDGLAEAKTVVRVVYHDGMLYVAADCYVSKAPLIQNLRRDGGVGGSDSFGIVLDPNNQQLSGYYFGLNAGNAQTDGLIEINSLSTDWNAKWLSAVAITPEKWTLEMAIPISTMRFPKQSKTWGINFVRADAQRNFNSAWNKTPLAWNTYNLAFEGQLNWQETISGKTKNNTLIPYIAYNASKDFTIPETKQVPEAGVDAKIAIGSRLNLDVTVNPDFSQIEVDNQIINLDRFNPMLPERRNFFLENASLFTDFGVGFNRPFISRSIGLAPDGRQIPIIGGIRLTGNLADKLRIGILDVQTEKFDTTPSQNLLVGVFDYKIMSNSTFKGILTNKMDFENSNSTKNTLGGLEFHYRTKDNSTQLSLNSHYTFSTFSSKESQFLTLYFGKIKRTWSNLFYYTDTGSNFNPEMGFSPFNTYFDLNENKVQRIGYRQWYNSFTKNLYFKSNTFNYLSFNFVAFYNLFSNGQFWEAHNENGISANFKNTATVKFTSQFYRVQLLFPTAFIGERVESGFYDIQQYNISYSSDYRSLLNYGFSAETADYYSGKRNSVYARINFRSQPHFDMRMEANYNGISLNEKNFNLLLLNSKADYRFNTNLLLSGLFQYNTQTENIGINIRFQWRFKPMSDLYFVYNDNYIANDLVPTFRSISVKMNYWFNF